MPLSPALSRLVKRLRREPLVHFALLGGLIFALWGLAKRQKPELDAEPEATAGRTVSRTVVVSPTDVATLKASFRAAWKRDPDPDELADQVQSFVSEEILFREGTALGLDRDDVVVRRRIIEKMTVLARPSGNRGEPTKDELRRWYETYRHRFRRSAELSFTQIFFDARKRSDPLAAARKLLPTLGDRPLPEGGASPPGDSFVLPTTMTDKTEPQVAHLFGEAFARTLMSAPVGSWQGPTMSNFGVHLFRISKREPQRLPPFEEAEKHVRADWLTVETRGLRAAAESLAVRYEVKLDPAVASQLADSPTLAPLLRRPR